MPRIGIYTSWGQTQDVGWWRYTFDQHQIPYKLIYQEDARAGKLSGYDVIILPSQGRSANAVVFDIPKVGKPLPYTKTAQYKYMGDYGSSPDIRGGMGLTGLAAIQRYVENGGTLITTGNSRAVVTQFNLVPYLTSAPVKGDFYAPGPIVTMQVKQPTHPIFYGYDAKADLPVRWATNMIYTMPVQYAADVLARFPGGKANVVSGVMRGADGVKDNVAIAEQRVGKGRVVMFATNPVWRWQTYGEFRMVYNALLNYRSLDGFKSPVPIPEAKDPVAP